MKRPQIKFLTTINHNFLKSSSGFTLLELSIVLVIIGLIVGGITVGADMIRAAELRSVITQQQKFKTATYTFKDKYFYLPGDITNAYDFWGSDCGSSAANCNGDGDGFLFDNYTTSDDDNDAIDFWSHLALAGMIEGSFSGNGYAYQLGTVVPESKISGAGWNVNKVMSGYTPMVQNNFFMVGAKLTGHLEAPAISPEEAWSIDKKIDDGRPDTGSVGVYTNASWVASYLPNCLGSTSTYNLDYDGIACHLIFELN